MCWQDTVIGRQARVQSYAAGVATSVSVPPDSRRIGLFISLRTAGEVIVRLGGDSSGTALLTLTGPAVLATRWPEWGQFVTGPVFLENNGGGDIYCFGTIAADLPPSGSGLEGRINWG